MVAGGSSHDFKGNSGLKPIWGVEVKQTIEPGPSLIVLLNRD